MYLELSLVFLSAAVLLIAAVSVPLLVQIQKVVRGLALTQELLQKSLPGILLDIEETVAHLKKTSVTVHQRVEGFSLALGKVQALFNVIMEMDNILRLGLRFPAFRFLRTAGAVAKGLRAFLRVYSTGRGPQ
jgi:hypothetical protein